MSVSSALMRERFSNTRLGCSAFPFYFCRVSYRSFFTRILFIFSVGLLSIGRKKTFCSFFVLPDYVGWSVELSLGWTFSRKISIFAGANFENTWPVEYSKPHHIPARSVVHVHRKWATYVTVLARAHTRENSGDPRFARAE